MKVPFYAKQEWNHMNVLNYYLRLLRRFFLFFRCFHLLANFQLKLYWDIKWLLHQKQIKEQFSWYNRAIYDWVSKVIWDSLVFALLRFMIGPENSRNSLDQ